MKKITVTLFTLAGVTLFSSANGAEVFNETFTGYNPAPVALVGQGSPAWTQLGASVVNPYQVNASGAVPMANNGQDAQRAFTSMVPLIGGNALVTEFDVTLSAAGTGDFFAHITSPETSPASPFYNRVYAQTAAGGFQLGLSAGTPISGAFYGASLSFNQPYHVISTWTFVDGAVNDRFSMTVDGSPYVPEFVWNTTAAEPSQLALVNLRQGAAASSPVISGIDNITVSAVPEPSVIALVVLGAGTLLFVGCRRRSVG